MRLIDADIFKSYIGTGHLRNPLEKCFSELDVVNMIDKQPTAYDIGEVTAKVYEITERIFNYCEEIDNNIPEAERTGYKMLPDILALWDIVRGEEE